jgi:accessory gene regulator protein AgrB
MHLRGIEPTLTDTLHIVFAIIWNLLAVLIIVFAAAALGARFRLYSAVTLATFVVFGVLTGREAPGIATGLPTPWIGVWERVIIGAFYLWLMVLAVALLRRGGDRGVQSTGVGKTELDERRVLAGPVA